LIGSGAKKLPRGDEQDGAKKGNHHPSLFNPLAGSPFSTGLSICHGGQSLAGRDSRLLEVRADKFRE
jgi:hypothetical protein